MFSDPSPRLGDSDNNLLQKICQILDNAIPIVVLAPTDAPFVISSTDIALTNARILQGTTNQVIITDNGPGSTMVLSLPQSIAVTSSPTFANLTLTGSLVGGSVAPSGALYVTLATDATLTNERVLTGTASQIILTDNGANSTIVLSLPQNIALTSTPQFAGESLTGAFTVVGSANVVQAKVTGFSTQTADIFEVWQVGETSGFTVNNNGALAQFAYLANTSSTVRQDMNRRGTTGDATAAVANGTIITDRRNLAWDGAAYQQVGYERWTTSENVTASAAGGERQTFISPLGSVTPINIIRESALAFTLTGGCRFVVTRGTVTANSPSIDATVTWSNIAVAFTHDLRNITDTNSDPASKFVDYQISGVSKFSVRKDGAATAVSYLLNGGGGLNATLTVYAVGTGYTLTTTPTLAAFGTTSPTLVISVAGTYRVTGFVRIDTAAATFAASQTVTMSLRRTNNTPANLTKGTAVLVLPPSTTISSSRWMPVDLIYTTALTTDSISWFASIDATPSAGSVVVNDASIVCQRLS